MADVPLLETLPAGAQPPAPARQRYYLSGPMSGIPDLNHPAFQKACDELRTIGLDVASPHELPDGEWSDCMRRDIRLLTECDAIVLLHGWPQSPGVRLELQIALALRMPVYIWVSGALVNSNLTIVLPELLS